MEKKKMGRPEKLQRNKEIVSRRNKGWTLEAIGDFYGITKPTVFEILKRHANMVRESA